MQSALRLHKEATVCRQSSDVAFKIPYMYDYITKLCRTQAEVILNHLNPNIHDIGKENPGTEV
jgi:hypothetical protein